MADWKNDEHVIRESVESKATKARLMDIGCVFHRDLANVMAKGMRGNGWNARVYHRYVKVDGVSYPVFMVVGREKA